MASTTTRDSLGRIVYVDDVVLTPHRTAHQVGAVGGDCARLDNGRRVLARLLTVDLDASPERTNYERYFADLGTLDEVIDAGDSCICDMSLWCSDCPFYRWGEAFGISPYDCIAFIRWLYEKAVV